MRRPSSLFQESILGICRLEPWRPNVADAPMLIWHAGLQTALDGWLLVVAAVHWLPVGPAPELSVGMEHARERLGTMGRSSIKTAERYLHSTEQDIRELVDSF